MARETDKPRRCLRRRREPATKMLVRLQPTTGHGTRSTGNWSPKKPRGDRRVIAKATLAGRWNKVHALLHLLTRSHIGKPLAVKQGTENTCKSFISELSCSTNIVLTFGKMAGMIHTAILKSADIQRVITSIRVAVDNAVRRYFTSNHRH